MRYTLQEQPNHTHLLLRHGAPVAYHGGLPTNAELEFWLEIEALRKAGTSLLAEIQAATVEGYIAGLTAFAWWKDGTQYVGTCGTTLAQAITDAREAHREDVKP